VGTFTLVFCLLSGIRTTMVLGAIEAFFYFLAAIGVRRQSRTAALLAFADYLLSGIVLQKYSGQGFGVGRIILLALLLANVRGIWLASNWPREVAEAAPVALNETIFDKLSDQLPAVVWPKGRFVFYAVAVLEFLTLTGMLVS
jgi:hypothetical protein